MYRRSAISALVNPDSSRRSTSISLTVSPAVLSSVELLRRDGHGSDAAVAELEANLRRDRVGAEPVEQIETGTRIRRVAGVDERHRLLVRG